ncbi:MAG: RNA-directed DNA polymerase [Pseudomonadota bacterium]
MRRAGNLYEAICDPNNLRLAFLRARRGKESRQEVLTFSRNLSCNLKNLRKTLLNETLEVGNYHYFTIRDPKERTICAAAFPERVLHHAIMIPCDPVFERHQIFDSYATRRDKGTFAALERAKRFTRQDTWFLKLDIKRYFDSVDHAILKEEILRLFKDERLLRLLGRIIDSYEKTPGKGIPIGNLTSQYFANHFLSIADHFIKETINVRKYIRYMDDMVLWGMNKEELLNRGQKLESFLENRLALALRPQCMNRSETGVPFLGFRVFPDRTLLRPGSRWRFSRKMKRLHEEYRSGAISQEDFGSKAEALTAHVAHASTRGFRQSVLKKLGVAQGLEPRDSWR